MEWKTLNTIRIYETDSHARRLQARVLSCEEGENGWLVELDRTIFYPTGGGQPCDMGTLGGADVTETLLRGETVLHRCTAALPVGADVTGEIDWARRLDLMQQHSGEHLVSGLIHARFGYENVGFHLGADLVTIDFNGEVDEQALQELERAANEAVWADFAPHIWYPEPDELAHLPYRSKKALTGAVRLVQFGDIDLCACCGTHVAHTGEIGLIKLVQHDAFPRRLAYRDGLRRPCPCRAERPLRPEPRHLRPPVGKARADGRRRGAIGLRADGGAAARRRARGPPVCPAGTGRADAPL